MISSDKFRLTLNARVLSTVRNGAQDERGATLVETALSMLILIGILFAVIQSSMAVYSYHYVANAAHETTRYAIVRGGSWTQTCDGTGTAGSGSGNSMCVASPEDIENYAATRGYPAIAISASDVCVEYYGSTSLPTTPTSLLSCTGNTGPNAPGNLVQVTITYPYSFVLPGIGSYSYNFQSTSLMVIAQ